MRTVACDLTQVLAGIGSASAVHMYHDIINCASHRTAYHLFRTAYPLLRSETDEKGASIAHDARGWRRGAYNTGVNSPASSCRKHRRRIAHNFPQHADRIRTRNAHDSQRTPALRCGYRDNSIME